MKRFIKHTTIVYMFTFVTGLFILALFFNATNFKVNLVHKTEKMNKVDDLHRNEEDSKDQDVTFDVSPSGNYIVFSTFGEGGDDIYDLYLLELSTLQVTRITKTPSLGEFSPSFSPDGKFISYAGNAKGHNNASIFTRSLKGKNIKQVTSPHNSTDAAPSFCSMKPLIVFARMSNYRPYSTGGYIWDSGDVYTINYVSGILHRITRQKYYRGVTSPKFSPNCKNIVYSAIKNSAANIFAVDSSGLRLPVALTTNKSSKATPEGPNSLSPAFSPDGKYIVFVSNRIQQYSYEIYVMRSDGTNPRKIVSASYDASPVFTRNGKCILFLRFESDAVSRRYELWQVDVTGKNLRRIADSSLFDNPLAWIPKKGG